jgi:hypothetical protein
MKKIEKCFGIEAATLLDKIEYSFEIGAAALKIKLSILLKWEQLLHGSLHSPTYS